MAGRDHGAPAVAASSRGEQQGRGLRATDIDTASNLYIARHGRRSRHDRDVAAAAGVSVATVSKVINDRYGVAEQTSARVREVIEQLGYTSSLVAQSLRSRSLQRDRGIASDIEPFNAELLKGAARGLRGTGYDLIVFSDCGRYEDQADGSSARSPGSAR